MCLIMVRDKDVVLDKEKFLTAVLNNPDGYGVSTPDGEGRLHTFKSVSKATGGEELYDLLHGEYKSDRLMIHLRYTTAGDTVLRNAHPFPILEKTKDGCDLRMAHNGTLHRWSPKGTDANYWESDTRCFVRGLIRPLVKRFAKGATTEDILTDPFIEALLEDNLTATSVLSFIDGHGNTAVINPVGNGGFTDQDGTYFSNEYSHDPLHRKPKSSKGGSSTPSGKFQGSTGATTSTSTIAESTTTSTTVTSEEDTFSDVNVETFSKKHGIEMEEELNYLSDETINFIVEEEGEDAVLLIKELLLTVYRTKKKLNSATKVIAAKSKQIKDLQEDKKKLLKEKTDVSTAA